MALASIMPQYFAPPYFGNEGDYGKGLFGREQFKAMSARLSGLNFGVDMTGDARFNLTRLATLLEEVHESLTGVVIENLNWLKFIDRCDRKGTLFYLDPPYFGNESDYGRSLFARDQFALMAERLWLLKGKFILSLNDRPKVREVFSVFRIREVQLTYSVAGSEGVPAKELIISER
ncbi:DNA adenine methylase [Rhizobium ruizarguesonis]|uniref:DNA adenine methylase n=1 Tax=Rhizobium ruizarguesonis TaxID=2081791 RepID=UPI0018D538CA|nr:DNA adenine methylase [Rhizobium ruizarguesonis]